MWGKLEVREAMLEKSMLRSLADRLQVDASDDHGVEVELALCLAPMIRCALRTGVGVPQVVAWAHAHAAMTRLEVSPDDLAQRLARHLSSTIVTRWCKSVCESVRVEDTVRVHHSVRT